MYCRSKISNLLLHNNRYNFAGLPFGKKRIPTRSDLQEYDLVVVGGHLGNVCATHLDAVLGEKVKILVSIDNQYQSIGTDRIIFEQGRIQRRSNRFNARELISKNNGKVDGVQSYDPQNNEIQLKNGRKIRYNNLLIACGLNNNYQSITGFEDAWSDPLHPFHTCQDHNSWKTNTNKHMRFLYNFTGGQAIFYIPPQFYAGEIQSYNFFVAKSLWDWSNFNGRISWGSSRFTIINANKSFCQHAPNIDQFIQEECQKRNINIEYDLELLQVQKDNQKAKFRNKKTGQVTSRLYHNMYSLMPTKIHQNLKQAGLTDNEGLLDVDAYTLQHKKYPNIFGLGDGTNLKTFRSFYGGLNQVAVARHNLERKLKGLQPNAEYDGYAQAPLFTENNRMIWVTHDYSNTNELIKENKFNSAITYKLYLLLGKSLATNVLKFKNWGPPFYKYRKTFPNQSQTLRLK